MAWYNDAFAAPKLIMIPVAQRREREAYIVTMICITKLKSSHYYWLTALQMPLHETKEALIA